MHAVDQVGTVPAALTTYLAVQEFKPDLILRCNAGTVCRRFPLPPTWSHGALRCAMSCCACTSC